MGIQAGVAAENNGGHFWKDGFWKGALVGFATGALGSIAPFGTGWVGSMAWGAILGTASQAGTIWANGGNDYSKIWQGALLGALGGFMAAEEFSNFLRGKGFHNNDEVIRRFKHGFYNESKALDYDWRQEVLDYFGFEGRIDLIRNTSNCKECDPGNYWGVTEPETGNIFYGRGTFKSYNDLKSTYYKELYHATKIKNGIPLARQPGGIDTLAPEERLGFIYQYKNQGLFPREFNKHIMGHIRAFENRILDFPESQKYLHKWWHFIYKIPRRW